MNYFQGYDIEARRKAKMNSDDRVIVIKPMEGKNVLSSTGMVDNRLFSGENKLHGIWDNVRGNWYLKYEIGGLPEGLRDNRFTTFSELLNYTKEYFRKRNIEVVSVE